MRPLSTLIVVRFFFGLDAIRLGGGFLAIQALMVTGLAASAVYVFGANPGWLTTALWVDAVLLFLFVILVLPGVSSVREMKRFLVDDSWAIWRYEPGTWKPVDPRRMPSATGVSGVLGVVAGVGAVFLCIGQLPIGLFLIVLSASLPLSFRLSRRYLDEGIPAVTAVTVWIGPTAMLRIPGGFWEFDNKHAPLGRVVLEETGRPAVLRFFQYVRPVPAALPRLEEYTAIPVPDGYLGEARALVDRFTEHLTTPRPPEDTEPEDPFGPPLPPSLLSD